MPHTIVQIVLKTVEVYYSSIFTAILVIVIISFRLLNLFNNKTFNLISEAIPITTK